MQQDKVSRVSDINKNVWGEDEAGRKTVAPPKKASYGQRWSNARPTKTVVFWSLLGAIVLTMIVGFVWGGWVTGGTAQKMAQGAAENAVTQRLASVCVAQFNQDPQNAQKLREMKVLSSWDRGNYVAEHGAATMPGEAKADRNVAAECAKQLTLAGQ